MSTTTRIYMAKASPHRGHYVLPGKPCSRMGTRVYLCMDCLVRFNGLTRAVRRA